MRYFFLLVFFFSFFNGKAEKLVDEADVMLSKVTYEVCANLYANTEIFVEDEEADRKVKIFLKVYAKAEDKKYGKLSAGSRLYDESGKEIGKSLIDFNLIDNQDSNGLPYFIYLRAYIFSDRIDQKSIPEKVLSQLCATHEGKLDSSLLADFIQNFSFQIAEDTFGFTLLKLEEQNQTRMTLVYRDQRLVAVVPKRRIELKYFEYKLSQKSLDIYYFERLTEEEEEWMITYFEVR